MWSCGSSMHSEANTRPSASRAAAVCLTDEEKINLVTQGARTYRTQRTFHHGSPRRRCCSCRLRKLKGSILRDVMACRSWPHVVPCLRQKMRVKYMLQDGSVRGLTLMSRTPRTGTPSVGCWMELPSEERMLSTMGLLLLSPVFGMATSTLMLPPWPSGRLPNATKFELGVGEGARASVQVTLSPNHLIAVDCSTLY
jgi:hypothetical protein